MKHFGHIFLVKFVLLLFRLCTDHHLRQRVGAFACIDVRPGVCFGGKEKNNSLDGETSPVMISAQVFNDIVVQFTSNLICCYSVLQGMSSSHWLCHGLCTDCRCLPQSFWKNPRLLQRRPQENGRSKRLGY